MFKILKNCNIFNYIGNLKQNIFIRILTYIHVSNIEIMYLPISYKIYNSMVKLGSMFFSGKYSSIKIDGCNKNILVLIETVKISKKQR